MGWVFFDKGLVAYSVNWGTNFFFGGAGVEGPGNWYSNTRRGPSSWLREGAEAASLATNSTRPGEGGRESGLGGCELLREAMAKI